jgi:hypothetical protein
MPRLEKPFQAGGRRQNRLLFQFQGQGPEGYLHFWLQCSPLLPNQYLLFHQASVSPTIAYQG